MGIPVQKDLNVRMPSDLTFENIEYLFQETILPVVRNNECGAIIFDLNGLLSNNGLIEPFGVIRLANYIFQLKNEGIVLKRAINKELKVKHSYGKTMRIFGLFGLGEDYGESYDKPFEKEGVLYYPLHAINLDNFKNDSLYTQGEIDDLSNKLAHIITSETKDSDFFKYISFSINEIIRNILQHSDSNSLLVMAQKWGSKRKCLELSIMDLGNGIDATLGKLANQLDNTNITPLKLSLIPGASSQLTTYINDTAENSGFGLYMISELVKDYGDFFILSGNEGISITKENRKHFTTTTLGTIISIRIDLNKLENYQNKMDKLRGTGLDIREKFEQNKHRAIMAPFASLDWGNLFTYEQL